MNLPQPIVDAVANDDYSRGNSDISVTQLISPPRMTALVREHWDTLEEDVSDRIFSLFGKAVHTILERAERVAIAEQRLYMKVGDWTVSGAMDRISIMGMDCPLHAPKSSRTLPLEIPADGGVLGVDGSDGGGVRGAGHGTAGFGLDVRTSVGLDSPLRANSAADGRVPFVRQPEVRPLESPFPGYALGQHEGRLVEGAPERAAESAGATLVSDGQPYEPPTAVCTGHVISDYKTASVNELVRGVKTEREQQLNIYRVLAELNGYHVERLEAVFILRDWSKIRASKETLRPHLGSGPLHSAYPQAQVVIYQEPLWEMEDAYKFIAERVMLHQASRIALPQCTDDERWSREPEFAVMKAGGKRASTVKDTQEEADEYIAAHPKDKYKVEARPGESIRCTYYCLAGLNGVCDQFKEMEAE